MDAIVLACGVVTCIIGGVLWFKVRAAVNALAKTSCEFSENSAKSARDAVQRVEAAMSDALAEQLARVQRLLDDASALNTSFDRRAEAHVHEVLVGMQEMLDSASVTMRQMLDDTHAMAADLDRRAETHAARMASQIAVAVEARALAEAAAERAQKRVDEAQAVLNHAMLEADQAVARARHAAEAARAACGEAEVHAQKVRSLPKGFGPEKDAHPGFASRTGSPYDPVA